VVDVIDGQPRLVSHARLDLALLEKAQEAVSLLARLERDQKWRALT
jgi:hypothetical protein